MVEAPDELEFGVNQEPQKWLPTLAAFSTAWTSGRPALALMALLAQGDLGSASIAAVVSALLLYAGMGDWRRLADGQPAVDRQQFGHHQRHH